MARRLYLSVTRPAITYASPIWWQGSKSNTSTLQTLENKFLRRITGCFKTSRTATLQAIAGIPPIDLALDHLSEAWANSIVYKAPWHPVRVRLIN